MTGERLYTDARKKQGFRSQAHLDAFYAAFDHARTCPDCQGSAYVARHDGLQPVSVHCDTWKQLDALEATCDR